MRKELQYFVWVFGLGVSLVAYAHFTFSTKEEVRDVKDSVSELREDSKATRQMVYDLWVKNK
jgi:hypothetical protein